MAKRLNTLGTSIQLRPNDLAFLFTQVSDPDLNTRNISGFGNNLANPSWGPQASPSCIWHRLISSPTLSMGSVTLPQTDTRSRTRG